MKTQKKVERTHAVFSSENDLLIWLEAFIIDSKARGLSSGTVKYYQTKFNLFVKYCESVAISSIDQIDPTSIRMYLLWLEQEGYNQGGFTHVLEHYERFLIGGKLR